MSTPDPRSDADEQFFEVAAGRQRGQPGAEALREALLAEARTVKEAEAASTDTLTASERAQMESLRSKVLEAGGFEPQRRSSRASSHGANRFRELLAEIGRWVLGDSMLRPAALAAALFLMTAVVWQAYQPMGDDEAEGMRGGPSHALVVADAAESARTLKARLAALGAEVENIQLSSSAWMLRIDVPTGVDPEPIKRALADLGLDIREAPPFEITVRQDKR